MTDLTLTVIHVQPHCLHVSYMIMCNTFCISSTVHVIENKSLECIGSTVCHGFLKGDVAFIADSFC